MKKYLLPQTGNFYKANLHSHSTFSDGEQTPLEMKETYMKMGYSVIAYTDHETLVDHSYLCDENFLALKGVEVGVFQSRDTVPYAKHCHIGFIATNPDINTEFWCDEGVEEEGKIRRIYNAETVNALIKRGKELGFFVTYNHPGWSMETYNEYMNYHGMHAMEIINWTGARRGHADHSPHVYDDMLRGGKRLFCIAADDNHHLPTNDFNNGCGGAFTVIKAERLEYNAITDALLAGNFYASQAPEIYDLWYEDGRVHVRTSPAYRIFFSTGRRSRKSFGGSTDEELVTETSFEVVPEDIYFRITVRDERGRYAHTNAYFCDELWKY